MFWIDILLGILYIIVVFICYKRGLLKTILTFLKTISSFFSAYYFQNVLYKHIIKIIPEKTNNYTNRFYEFIPQNILIYLKGQTINLIAMIISFIFVFILSYLITSIIGNIINHIIKKNIFSKFVNSLGGFIIGLFLGLILIFIASFIIGALLIAYNPTIAISTIYKSFLLKLFIADNISLISNNIIKNIPFINNISL